MSLFGGEFPEPREFQVKAHERLRQGAADKHRCQMLMSPTGSGKTFLGMRAISEALKKGRRAIFVADRTVLVAQTSAVADQYGLSNHGIIQANNWRTNLSRPFQIASIQTLAKRGWPEADLIVIDEAHAQYDSWVTHIQQTDAFVIGLSATPFSAGLGKLFTNLVNAATMHDLTEQGILVPMRVFKGIRADMTGAQTVGGEWSDKAAEERGLAIVGDIVTEWCKHGENRKTIAFGSTIKHCEEICRQFNEAGISAAVFTSETTAEEREMLLREYRKTDSNLRVLCSVAALSKGFDVPDVGCVILARPLRKSLSEVIQMIGRGLRSSVDTGKSDCIILDHAGNMTRFAEDIERIYYDGLDKLDAGEKLDKAIRKDDEEKEASSCPKCGHSPFFKRCMKCGHERQSISLVEQVPGELQEVLIGKKKLADDRMHLWQQVCAYARQHSAPEKQRGRALSLFKEFTGVWPPKHWSFEATPDAPITATTANFIRSRNIRFAKGREKAVA